MGRKKIKKSEKVERLVTYVKKKHKERVLGVVSKEVEKIKLEELLEKQAHDGQNNFETA